MQRIGPYLRFLYVAAAIVLLLVWLADVYLQNAWVNGLRQSSPDSGQTIPYAVKGIIVYITQEQRRMMDWVHWVEIGAAGVVGIGVAIIGWLRRRPR